MPYRNPRINAICLADPDSSDKYLHQKNPRSHVAVSVSSDSDSFEGPQPRQPVYTQDKEEPGCRFPARSQVHRS